MSHNPDLPRCGWVPPHDELYCHYHDTEWGIPNYDSKSLFSKLIQDGMQAGLAWITILRKRESILDAFDNLDPDIIAHYTDKDRERLMNNPGIIRSKLKINAAITNAQIFIKMRDEEHIDFSEYLWGFVDGKPIVNSWEKFNDAPVKSQQSEAMAKDLKKRGFKFTGPVIIYAFMQAVGMVIDHEQNCHARAQCLK
ncbi:MAG TPA: DNA-3-methyladenine glycosylase I [Hellea balneolensis]|uniref:DNA-3-methyladenine glycosylase I n=1 Tax=Hellea balneolensis TaxID=287478 RepID=A0A7C5M095_9PROT|nr:DNA-3-methyladenine glycosylase I [Hellea balneolensis]